MYKHWRILKTDLEEKREEYAQVAEWCNQNQEYIITEDETHYRVIKKPEPTLEEKISEKKAERNDLLRTVVDPVVTNPLRWEELTEEMQAKYRAYRLYLLKLDKQEEFPDIEIKSFEEF